MTERHPDEFLGTPAASNPLTLVAYHLLVQLLDAAGAPKGKSSRGACNVVDDWFVLRFTKIGWHHLCNLSSDSMLGFVIQLARTWKPEYHSDGEHVFSIPISEVVDLIELLTQTLDAIEGVKP